MLACIGSASSGVACHRACKEGLARRVPPSCGPMSRAVRDRLWRTSLSRTRVASDSRFSKLAGPGTLAAAPKTNTKPCGTVSLYGAAVTGQTGRRAETNGLTPVFPSLNGLIIHRRERSSGRQSFSWRFQRINTGRLVASGSVQEAREFSWHRGCQRLTLCTREPFLERACRVGSWGRVQLILLAAQPPVRPVAGDVANKRRPGRTPTSHYSTACRREAAFLAFLTFQLSGN